MTFSAVWEMSVAIWLSEHWRLSVATKKRKRHCVKSYDKNADSSNNERERDSFSNDIKYSQYYKTRKEIDIKRGIGRRIGMQ